MHMLNAALLALCGALAPQPNPAQATATSEPLRLEDIFELEFVGDPQISPDGSRVVYERHFMDIMSDRVRSNLWIQSTRGEAARPLTTGARNDRSPRWSPDGTRILYLSSADGPPQILVRWIDGGEVLNVCHLPEPPAALCWSPDGRTIAFSMLVKATPEPFVALPTPPEGASWATPPRFIQRPVYRADGQGFLPDGHEQLFVVPAEGGTPRALTGGSFPHTGPYAWTPDSEAIVLSANRSAEREFEPRESELYEWNVATGEGRALTSRRGPDTDPSVSPDGRFIAYLGFDDQLLGYQATRLYRIDRATGASREWLAIDRSIESPTWAADSSGVYFAYDDEGDTRIAFVDLDGEVRPRARGAGGLSLGRPYAGASFSVARDGTLAFTATTPEHPADLAVLAEGDAAPRRLTRLNDDLFGQRKLAAVEMLWCESSFDGRRVQCWLARPPDFDPARRYPLLLEIHGGPFANYGGRFAAEIQLYAAAGYVVLYVNPRGSTSYGEEFANLIHHRYPGEDYDDLMSAVDAIIARGFVDPEQLFVTGGSGGGVLTAWIIGKTDRFRAAVVAKPVINWLSFALTADLPTYFWRYWFDRLPWDDPEEYWRRSPLSLVGNVKTPTMLLTGEDDHRTPITESEQYYQALQLRRIDSALVRIPGASHGIAARPSQLMAKVAHVLAWFDRQRDKSRGTDAR